MKITAEPRSDQWNADDFVGGARTFTIAGVRTGTAEQKYDIDLVEGEGRSWRPPLTVLRLLIAAWGDDGTQWVGKRVTLFRDPSIRFGKDQVGGIRISHMSGIDKPMSVSLTVTRGKRSMFKVEPLPDAPAAPKLTQQQVDRLDGLLKAKGINVADVLPGIAHIIGRPVTHRDALTTDEFDKVIAALEARPDAEVTE